VLTGAGVSAESGVPTFRGSDGLWEGHRVEDVATPEAFARDPALVWRFYNLRRAKLWTVRPNPGHHALAELERRWGPARFTVCTQNIDGLHRAAGSRHVLELHGNLARVRCTGCDRVEERPGEDLPELPRCAGCDALLRPDIVWFHEMLPQQVWREAAESAGLCDCFLVVGTSAVVYPAAGLVDLARQTGASVVEVNADASAVSSCVDVHLRGKSGEILPRLVQLLSESGDALP
jgi:NAD-dependent deacetylase